MAERPAHSESRLPAPFQAIMGGACSLSNEQGRLSPPIASAGACIGGLVKMLELETFAGKSNHACLIAHT